MEIDSVLHDQALMAWMEHRGNALRHKVNDKIVRADDANLLVTEVAAPL